VLEGASDIRPTFMFWTRIQSLGGTFSIVVNCYRNESILVQLNLYESKSSVVIQSSNIQIKPIPLMTWQHITVLSNATVVYSDESDLNAVALLNITRKQNLALVKDCVAITTSEAKGVWIKNLKVFDGPMKTHEVINEMIRNDGVSVFKENLIHYWPMSGENPHVDIAGGHNMTIISNVNSTEDRFDNAQSALLFNGGHAILPPGVYFNPDTGGFTIMLWIRLLSINKVQQVFKVGNGLNKARVKVSINTHRFRCCLQYRCYWVDLDKGLVNRWTHLTCSHYANGKDGEIRMYINGKMITTWIINDKDFQSFKKVERNDNYIGQPHGDDQPENLHAKVNELKIFDRPLSTDQVKRAMYYEPGLVISK
jgi:hypothetical protein